MKVRLLLWLILWGTTALSAQTVVQQFSAVSSGAGTVSDMDLPKPTGKGHVLVAMPVLLSPDVKVVAVTDNAPGGGNTYQEVPASAASCKQRSLDIWYCEKCNPGVTELKFHLSGHVTASINSFLEVSGLALPSVLDGSGVTLSDGIATSDGVESGPSITTTTPDFLIARYFSDPPMPNSVTPASWTHTKSYVYVLNGASGTYQPTLAGAHPASGFCMSIAAFKVAESAASPPQRHPALETRVR